MILKWINVFTYIHQECSSGIGPVTALDHHNALTVALGLYSLSDKTSYRKISWSLEAARFGFGLFQWLWNIRGISAAAVCQISERYDHYNTQSRGFETSRDLAVRRLTA